MEYLDASLPVVIIVVCALVADSINTWTKLRGLEGRLNELEKAGRNR